MPEAGGGFTFVEGVFEAFLGAASRTEHEFIVYCNSECANTLKCSVLPKNVRIVALRPRSWFEKGIAALKHFAPFFGYFWRRLSPLERRALSDDIKLMWFVGGIYDTLDMPYIATVWDVQHLTHPWFPEVSSAWEWEYREYFNSRYLRRATYVITGTEVGKLELENFYRLPSKRVRIIPHPTPSFIMRPADISLAEIRARFGLSRNYMFYPAQFWAHKNHVNLLFALRLLVDRDEDAPDLVFVGSDKGNLQHVRSEVEALNLTNRVHFLGFVSRAELIGLYQGALALVYASFSGPENLPPLEAFGLKCPVLASDFPGAREQLGNSALFFDPSCPETIARAMKLVMTDEHLRRELVERGFTRASEWSESDYVSEIFSVLDEFDNVRRCWP